MKNLKIFILVFMMVSLFVFQGCGGGGPAGAPGEGTLKMTVHYPQDQKNSQHSIKDESSDDSDFVAYYIVSVFRSGSSGSENADDPLIPPVRVDYPETTATLMGVPVGPVYITIEGFNEDNVLIYFGSIYMDVTAGFNEPAEITITPYNPTPTPTVTPTESPEPSPSPTPTLSPVIEKTYIWNESDNAWEESDTFMAGYSVRITGSSFGGSTPTGENDGIYFGTIKVDNNKISSWSNTEIVCTFPKWTSDGKIRISSNGATNDPDDPACNYYRKRVWSPDLTVYTAPADFDSFYQLKLRVDPRANMMLNYIFFSNVASRYNILSQYFSSSAPVPSGSKTIKSKGNDSWSTPPHDFTGNAWTADSHDVGFWSNGTAIGVFAAGIAVVTPRGYSSVFSTAGQTWSAIAEINQTNPAYNMQMAVGNNNATGIIYRQEVAGFEHIYGKYLNNTTMSWSNAEQVDENISSSSDMAQSKFNKYNSAMAIYRQSGDLKAVRYSLATGTWNSAAPDLLVSPMGAINSDGTHNPVLVFDNEGNAMVVCITEMSGAYSLVSKRFNLDADDPEDIMAGTWEAGTKTIDSTMGTHYNYPQLHFLPNGDAICIFGIQDSDGENKKIKASRYNKVAGTWGPLMDVDSTTDPSYAWQASSAQDPDGNIYCAFIENKNVKVNYFNGTAWTGAVQITNDTAPANSKHETRIVVDYNYNVTIAYIHWQANRANIRYLRYE